MKANDKELNRLSGRYEIIELVGAGGMSYVYKAYDSKHKKIVAIKVLKDELSLDEEFVNKFKSEALSTKDIKHENVISAIDFVDEGSLHYIVMEYFDGNTLNKYIKDKGHLSNEETVKIAIQVASGLLAAHKRGIIHRDIKPQNIVIDDKKVAKITDFGIARAISSTTRNISVVGTVHYISPEQVRNTTVDFRSDIYSFGCTIYEMITGIVPFSGETPLEVIIAHLRENIKAPHLDNPDIYKSLEKIILKATRMIPRERYQSMEDMISDLEKAISNKDGEYIKDYDVDDDQEGKTVIISDDDMKVIKAVSQKFTNRSSYKEESKDLTPEQKAFFEKYIKNGAFKQHQMMKKIVAAAIIAVVILIIIICMIILDTRKRPNNEIEPGQIGVENLAKSLDGIDIELAKNLAKDYDIVINVVRKDFSDKIEEGKIISVVSDNVESNNSIDVIVSKGSYDIDFKNTEKLNNTKWSDLKEKLDDRNIKYKVSEINDINIPRGYIIGVNKKNTKDGGELVVTVSRGISDQIKSMPDLTKKPISEAKELIEANELVLGNISYIRDYNIPENHVISQSIIAGDEVKAGTTVDLTLSCGKNGVEIIATNKPKWYSEFSGSYRVVKDNSPQVGSSDETMILQVRLMQNTSEGVVYTELMEPQEYKVGTIIPLMFTKIEGEEKVQKGQIQVVDVVNDKVLYSAEIMFWPPA